MDSKQEGPKRATIHPGVSARFTYSDGTRIVGEVKGRDDITGDWLIHETGEYKSPLEVPGWTAEVTAKLMELSYKDLLIEAQGRGLLARVVGGFVVGRKIGLCAMVMMDMAVKHPGVLVAHEHPVQKLVLNIPELKEITILTDEYINGILEGIASYG